MKRLWICVALLALPVAGCGGSGKTATAAVSGVLARTPGTLAATSPQSTNPNAVKPGQATVQIAAFRSPDGNVGCLIGDGQARCEIDRHDWTAPPRPATCSATATYGQSLVVTASDRARFACGGGEAFNPSDKALPDGTAAVDDGFTCQGSLSHVTCTDDATAHGFFISVEHYRAF